MRPYILAIDPGTEQSGICLTRTEDYKPLRFGKIHNELILSWLYENDVPLASTEAVIERMQGNSFSVGESVFLTCEWIGTFKVYLANLSIPYSFIYRREEYKQICGNIYTRNDKGITDALVDRFCPYGTAKTKAKGTKANPGWFYGFSKDVWQAYAQSVAYIDIQKEKKDDTCSD